MTRLADSRLPPAACPSSLARAALRRHPPEVGASCIAWRTLRVRLPGTARGSPTGSRTAKASRISRHAAILRPMGSSLKSGLCCPGP
jgi:hypothetical protein